MDTKRNKTPCYISYIHGHIPVHIFFWGIFTRRNFEGEVIFVGGPKRGDPPPPSILLLRSGREVSSIFALVLIMFLIIKQPRAKRGND